MARAVDHDVRKRMIVMKAMKIFAAQGYAKVSFATISDATGLARTALYRYFKTKRELFDEAIHELTSGIMMELRDIMARDNPVPKRIEMVCDQVIEEFFAKKDFFLAIFDFVFSMVRIGEDMSGRISMFTHGLRLVFKKLIIEGLKNDSIRSGTDPDDASDMLYSVVEAVALKVILGVNKKPGDSASSVRAAVGAITK